MKSGIYLIHHKPSDKVYIGSSLNVAHRLNVHKRQLDRGEHHCAEMQSYWAKSDDSQFTFDIVEFCESSELAVREQLWLNANYRRLMNTATTASRPGSVAAKWAYVNKQVALSRSEAIPDSALAAVQEMEQRAKKKALLIFCVCALTTIAVYPLALILAAIVGVVAWPSGSAESRRAYWENIKRRSVIKQMHLT